MSYVLTLDQGTTSSRAIIFNNAGEIVAVAQQEFTQFFPKSGWVEHDPLEIWRTQRLVMEEVMTKSELGPQEITCIGITNQRETTLVWDKKTGKPIYNAIVWQDTRTTEICNQLSDRGLEGYIRENTGLVIDSYFSGTKLKWILDNVEGARNRADRGELLFGTVDSWLIWNLTKGKTHVTDYSNASRTMLFNIKELSWDDKMLNELDIPKKLLPTVQDSSSSFGEVQIDGVNIPITGVAGDQQAALFGQQCYALGDAKNTYGTGCFMLMNTGDQPIVSKSGLITTIAWGIGGKITYALEGSVFIAGAAIQWLRDGLKIIDEAADSAYFASKTEETDQVYVVPAFAGLGAPYWDMYARGAIFGLTRDTGKSHIVRATLESLAYQTKDVLMAMETDSDIKLRQLQVDGGASANDILMQFQSDILDVEVCRPAIIESTALGAAYLAGIGAGIWHQDILSEMRQMDRTFSPEMDQETRKRLYRGWGKAVKRSMNWID